MLEGDKAFVGSIPDVYDTYLVPLIFESYAEDLARRVAETDPRAVLETAAGSGVVARALAPKLDPGARFAVTDLNKPMLDRARARQPEDQRIEWLAADALALPFDDASFDVVCCQFAVMFFPDQLGAYREAYRVLRPGGRFLFSVWDRIEENEFADCVTRTVSAMYPDDPPVFMARTPHGHHDLAPIRADLAAAGFGAVTAVTVADQSRADHPRIPALAYCQGTPLRNELEARDPGRLDAITDRAGEDIARRFGAGPVTAKVQGHIVTAVK